MATALTLNCVYSHPGPRVSDVEGVSSNSNPSVKHGCLRNVHETQGGEEESGYRIHDQTPFGHTALDETGCNCASISIPDYFNSNNNNNNNNNNNILNSNNNTSLVWTADNKCSYTGRRLESAPKPQNDFMISDTGSFPECHMGVCAIVRHTSPGLDSVVRGLKRARSPDDHNVGMKHSQDITLPWVKPNCDAGLREHRSLPDKLSKVENNLNLGPVFLSTDCCAQLPGDNTACRAQLSGNGTCSAQMPRDSSFCRAQMHRDSSSCSAKIPGDSSSCRAQMPGDSSCCTQMPGDSSSCRGPLPEDTSSCCARLHVESSRCDHLPGSSSGVYNNDTNSVTQSMCFLSSLQDRCLTNRCANIPPHGIQQHFDAKGNNCILTLQSQTDGASVTTTASHLLTTPFLTNVTSCGPTFKALPISPTDLLGDNSTRFADSPGGFVSALFDDSLESCDLELGLENNTFYPTVQNLISDQSGWRGCESRCPTPMPHDCHFQFVTNNMAAQKSTSVSSPNKCYNATNIDSITFMTQAISPLNRQVHDTITPTTQLELLSLLQDRPHMSTAQMYAEASLSSSASSSATNVHSRTIFSNSSSISRISAFSLVGGASACYRTHLFDENTPSRADQITAPVLSRVTIRDDGPPVLAQGHPEERLTHGPGDWTARDPEEKAARGRSDPEERVAHEHRDSEERAAQGHNDPDERETKKPCLDSVIQRVPHQNILHVPSKHVPGQNTSHASSNHVPGQNTLHMSLNYVPGQNTSHASSNHVPRQNISHASSNHVPGQNTSHASSTHVPHQNILQASSNQHPYADDGIEDISRFQPIDGANENALCSRSDSNALSSRSDSNASTKQDLVDVPEIAALSMLVESPVAGKRKLDSFICDEERDSGDQDSPPLERPTKRLTLLTNTPKQRKEERRKILRVSVQKLREMDERKLLERSVLIRNTVRKIQEEVRGEKKKRIPFTRSLPYSFTPFFRTIRSCVGYNSVVANDDESNMEQDLNGFCVYDSPSSPREYIFDDPIIYGDAEKITDDMTETLLKNLEVAISPSSPHISNIDDLSTNSSTTTTTTTTTIGSQSTNYHNLSSQLPFLPVSTSPSFLARHRCMIAPPAPIPSPKEKILHEMDSVFNNLICVLGET